MKTKIVSILAVAGLSLSATAQDFSVLIEPGFVKLSGGENLTFDNQTTAGVKLFFAAAGDVPGPVVDPLAPTPDEVATFGALSWTEMQPNSFAGGYWTNPGNFGGGEAYVSGVPGGSLVFVAITTAENVGATTAGDSVALFHWNKTTLGLGASGFATSETSTILMGQSGSVQMVSVVPEPSSYALLAGVFGLAWVMVRRRN